MPRSCDHEGEAAAAPRRAVALHLSKLKAPRALERLDQTAAKARDESWPYEQFLEVLLEAEVFARDASGAHTRVRSAQFPCVQDARGLRLAGAAGRRAPARHALGAARLDRGAHLASRRVRDGAGVGLAARGSAGPQPPRGRAAPARALPPADRRRGRLPT